MKYWTNKRITYATLAAIAVVCRICMGLAIAYVLVFGIGKTYLIWDAEHPVADLSKEVYQLSRLERK